MESMNALKQQLGSKTMKDLPAEVFAEVGGLADRFVQEINVSRLKPTQLRRIFHLIKDMQREFQHDKASFSRGKIAIIMPQLAYAYGRDLIPREFYEMLTYCFGRDKCVTQEDFDNAADFLEAVMAYHKYYSKNR